MLELNSDRYSNAVTSLQKDYMIAMVYDNEKDPKRKACGAE